MTPQQIVGLATRLMAIWIAILSFQSFLIVRALQRNNVPDLASYSVAGVYLVLALLLWFFPMFVAHRLIPRTRYDDVLRLPVHQTVVVACIVLGLVVIALRALPGLATYVTIAILTIADGQMLSLMDPGTNVSGGVALLEFAVGLFLALKAPAIAHRLLPGATTPAVAADPDE